LMSCADEAMYSAKRAVNRTPQVRECGAALGVIDVVLSDPII
jgi:hypothetical protein